MENRTKVFERKRKMHPKNQIGIPHHFIVLNRTSNEGICNAKKVESNEIIRNIANKTEVLKKFQELHARNRTKDGIQKHDKSVQNARSFGCVRYLLIDSTL